MAQVPVSLQVVIYPRDKSVKPYPATIVGYAWITGLAPGGGPMPGGGGPIELPPIDVPPPVEGDGTSITITVKEAPAAGGWGLNLDEGWYWTPGAGQAGPKK
jgi:hypothetical protein